MTTPMKEKIMKFLLALIVLGIFLFRYSLLQDLAVLVGYLVVSTIIAFGAPVRWPPCLQFPYATDSLKVLVSA
jgi:hypothetical protein